MTNKCAISTTSSNSSETSKQLKNRVTFSEIDDSIELDSLEPDISRFHDFNSIEDEHVINWMNFPCPTK